MTNSPNNWRQWQRQLVREHEQLSAYYGLKLPTPLLVIGAAAGRAGSWRAEPGPGVLEIAAWLIGRHGWDVVLEVLKHEMSHQYVAQVMGRGHEPPHGPAFQEACRRLGVHPLFRRAQSEIPRLLPGNRSPASATLPVMAKIEKLLALAASANEHEATLAMAKAGDLMRRHNLERLADPAGQNPVAAAYDYLVISTGRRRRPPHHAHLAAILQDFFYVKTISYPLYDSRHDQCHQVLELLGARENLAVAEYVYQFLAGQLPRLWQRYRLEGGAPGRARNSYYIGVLNGFREKLRQQETTRGGRELTLEAMADQGWSAPGANATCSSLVCAGDRGLQEFLAARYPRLRKIRGKGTRLYADTYQAGRAEGRKIVIRKGIKERQGNRGKLLP
ncbi:SprT-like domain-containing protein [Desulfurivibrio sp. C05AmB]|uniref:SprT-like domain-containing protein n=1 Tax=Desulfurivibrio sp. C05AmB TaxID=3374371 RepID=UPI00376EFFEF